MKQYYLHNGTEQQGPFTIDELKEKNITKATPIWHEGITEWTTAGAIEELKELFKITTPPPFEEKKSIPPQFPKQEATKQQANQSKPAPIKKDNSITIIVTIIIAVVLITMVSVIIANIKKSGDGSSGNLDTQTYQEKVMTVEEMEKSDPAKFLEASGSYRENFWGDAMKVEGTIKNNATVANYKDVVVEVVFYSETDTELDRRRYTVFEFCPAHSTIAFKLKLNRPQACKKLGWTAVSAKTY